MKRVSQGPPGDGWEEKRSPALEATGAPARAASGRTVRQQTNSAATCRATARRRLPHPSPMSPNEAVMRTIVRHLARLVRAPQARRLTRASRPSAIQVESQAKARAAAAASPWAAPRRVTDDAERGCRRDQGQRRAFVGRDRAMVDGRSLAARRAATAPGPPRATRQSGRLRGIGTGASHSASVPAPTSTNRCAAINASGNSPKRSGGQVAGRVQRHRRSRRPDRRRRRAPTRAPPAPPAPAAPGASPPARPAGRARARATTGGARGVGHVVAVERGERRRRPAPPPAAETVTPAPRRAARGTCARRRRAAPRRSPARRRGPTRPRPSAGPSSDRPVIRDSSAA